MNSQDISALIYQPTSTSGHPPMTPTWPLFYALVSTTNIGMIESDEEETRFNWGVKSLPWMILADKQHIVRAEGFAVSELDERIEEITTE